VAESVASKYCELHSSFLESGYIDLYGFKSRVAYNILNSCIVVNKYIHFTFMARKFWRELFPQCNDPHMHVLEHSVVFLELQEIV
jgi:hypothetical protein